MMDALLYIFVRALVGLIQALPLLLVARIGRAGGALFYWLDGRHRRVAQQNLRLSFPEKSKAEIGALARENFKRIGENFSCAVKTASMSREEVAKILEVTGVEKFYV